MTTQLTLFDPELMLDRIKARALEQRARCSGRMGDETIAECWSAILGAANELDPPLHEAITRSAIDTTKARSNPASKEN